MVLPTLRYPLSTAGVRCGEVLAGKYRVERLLGRGGMGIVVAATHVHLGERVAVKLLLPGSALTPSALARFLREGRAAARVKSEHVARVHDAGTLDTGEPYLVLEYLEGTDLRTLVKERGPLPLGVALEYLLQVCEGLAEAHSRGVVHRDLKPANLFLARRADGSRAVKIIDFGVSKITSDDGPEASGYTVTGAAMGTPNYMAPEQMRCARSADARADIWSIGAVLFGLLTGSSPFPGESVIEVYDRILKGAPRLADARPDVPPELSAVVDRCLRIEPAERFQDVGELALALSDLVPEERRAALDRTLQAIRSRPIAGSVPEGDLDGLEGLDDADRTGPVLGLGSGRSLGSESAPATSAPVTEDALEPSWGAPPPPAALALAPTPAPAEEPAAPDRPPPTGRIPKPRLLRTAVLVSLLGASLVSIGLAASRALPVRSGAALAPGAPPRGSGAAPPGATAAASQSTAPAMDSQAREPLLAPTTPDLRAAGAAPAGTPATPSTPALPTAKPAVPRGAQRSPAPRPAASGAPPARTDAARSVPDLSDSPD